MGQANSCFGSASYSCMGSMPVYGDTMMMGDPYSNAPIMGAPLQGSPNIFEQRGPSRPAQPEIEESRYGRNPLLPEPKSLNRDPSRAMVTIKAPNDGTITCDGTPVKLTNGEKSFFTPSLPSGQKFEYTFRFEYVKDGERRIRERVIQVRAGGTSICDFTDEVTSQLPAPPSPSLEKKDDTQLATKMIPSNDPMKTPGLFPISMTARNVLKNEMPSNATVSPANPSIPAMPSMIQPTGPERAKFSLRVPESAVVYVDGRKTTKAGTVREFSTPALPPGQEFKYEIKVEVPGAHGYPQTINTTVSFKAGETLPELNFEEMLKKTSP
jgi:uncharacterized protein (TIGR03000 family)